jgi:Tfp pilus assembly protein PilF
MTIQNSTQPKKLQRITANEFAQRLSYDLGEQDKRYAFFLGSGCSVSSGIKTAGGLVTEEWLPRLHKIMTPVESDALIWGRDNFEYNSDDPASIYGKLMKRVFLQKEEQQREIERICDNKFPAFGYAVLALLMERAKASGTFNVVLTTNFDDLVADALYLFTSIRPLVIHHESLANYIRPTRTRPLIVKLHGDNHFSPYNTPEQTAVLPEITSKQVSTLLHDRGLIFLGYSGNDQSIVRLLEALPEDALPFGIYWCSSKEPSCKLSEWLYLRRAIWVETPDFDRFMLLVRTATELKLPESTRFETVFDKLMNDYRNLSGSIDHAPDSTAEQVALQVAVAKTNKSFPNWRAVLLEAYRYEETNPMQAETVYENGIMRFADSAALLSSYALFLSKQKRSQEAEALYMRAIEANPAYSINLINYALFLSRQKRPQEAEVLYKRAIDADSQAATHLSDYAVFLSEQKRFQEAEAFFKRAIEAGPKEAISLNDYAVFLSEQKRPQEAEIFYKRALEADPKEANYLSDYAGFLDKQKRLHEAETYYKRAIEIDPKDAIILSNYALFLKEQKRPQEAETFYKRALEADPKDADTYSDYGDFLSMHERSKEAETFYKRAVEIDPTNAIILSDYAFFLGKQKRPQEAETFYKRALEADPTDARILSNYAIFLNKHERPQESETYFKRALEADPEGTRLGNYALFLDEQKRPQEAEAFYKRALEANPTDTSILSNYAILLDEQKRPKEAETLYKHALEVAFEDIKILGNYAIFLNKHERLQEAEIYFKRALEADPKHAIMLGNYALFLSKHERPQEAEIYFKRALEADPEDANILGSYATFLDEQKRPQEAETLYKHALEVASENIKALVSYAIFLSNHERPQEAETYFKRAIEIDSKGTSLGDYALFLNEQKRPQEAEALYKRAIEADPTNANNLANYAQLILIKDVSAGLAILDRAQALITEGSQPGLLLELDFYNFAHRSPLGNTAHLSKLKYLLLSGARSKEWNLSPNVERAQLDGHPFAEWLPKLAAVIVDESPVEVLNDWTEWQQANE